MTKKEIVKQISEKLGLTQLKVKVIVQMVFDLIIDTLIEKKRIELRNFGVFEVKKRAARVARNPRTGDPVRVPAKYVVTFKPGKTMEERVLRLEQEELAAAGESDSPAASSTSSATAPIEPAKPSAPPPDDQASDPTSAADTAADPESPAARDGQAGSFETAVERAN